MTERFPRSPVDYLRHEFFSTLSWPAARWVGLRIQMGIPTALGTPHSIPKLLNIEQAVRIALRDNPDVLLARLGVHAAQGRPNCGRLAESFTDLGRFRR